MGIEQERERVLSLAVIDVAMDTEDGGAMRGKEDFHD